MNEATKILDSFYSDAKSSFATQIYKRLNELNISTEDYEKALHTTSGTVSKILKGCDNFSIESMIRYSVVLGCKIELNLVPIEKSQNKKEIKINESCKRSYI